MNNVVVIGAGVVVIGGGLYLLLAKPSPALQKKGAGLGGITNVGGPKAFPTGQVATSLASIATSIFGGAGTHSPASTTIRPGSATGPIITTLDGTGGSPLANAPESTGFAYDTYGDNNLPPPVATLDTNAQITQDQFIFDTGV